MEQVDHPPHYGGADDPFEAIKVIEAWDLGFHLGNAVKYIKRAGAKNPVAGVMGHAPEPGLTDLRKARWYLDRLIQQTEQQDQAGR